MSITTTAFLIGYLSGIIMGIALAHHAYYRSKISMNHALERAFKRQVTDKAKG